MKHEAMTQAAKAGPAVIGAGITLSDISTMVTIGVGLATLLYVLAQLGYLIWKWRRQMRDPNPEFSGSTEKGA